MEARFAVDSILGEDHRELHLGAPAAQILPRVPDEEGALPGSQREVVEEANAGKPLGPVRPSAYNPGMIRDLEAYRQLSEEERFEALRAMTAEESIALGEALLTSEVMDLAEFPDDDHPLSLAIALGISRPGDSGRG